MQNKPLVGIFMAVGLLALYGCGQSSTTSPGAPNSSAGNSGASGEQKSSEPLFAPKPVVVEAGTPIRVTVDQSVSSKTSNPRDHFDASLAAPIVVGEKVVIPSGARARGTVTDAKSAGKFKGNAAISVTLSSVTIHGNVYKVRSSEV